jgi:hypothetical protein
MHVSFNKDLWAAEIYTLKGLRTYDESERFLNLVEIGKLNITREPIFIGKTFFSIFSSLHDHGVYESVFRALSYLSIHDYYYCLISVIDVLVINDPNNHWRTTVVRHPDFDPDADIDVKELVDITQAYKKSSKNLRKIFVNQLGLSGMNFSNGILNQINLIEGGQNG